MTRRAAVLVAVLVASLLGSGCSVLFGPELSEGCTGDADKDGHLALGCGGDDCDDNDPDIPSPDGEVCDGDGVDEDCDPQTIGPDMDGDGQVSTECFNLGVRRLSGGSIVDVLVEGTDCDDTRADVFEGAPELCDFEDNDCDLDVDEGLEEHEWFADCDLDGLGSDYDAPELACMEPEVELICESGDEATWVPEPGDCDDEDEDRQTTCGACADVDLLVVMDAGEGMMAEQLELVAQVARLPEVLLRTGDLDGDGEVDFQPVQSLHAAVVTSDLGTAPHDVPGCTAEGDDARLRTSGMLTGCDAPAVREAIRDGYVEFVAGGEELDADLLRQWGCLAVAGNDACRVEQPLEAGLEALTPAGSTLRFGPDGDQLGHGDGANRGFLREDSLLVVLYVTNQDDCSVEDRELLNPDVGSTFGTTAPAIRCVEHPIALHPLSRYVSGLLQIRSVDDLVVGIVAGVPPALVPADGVIRDQAGYQAILDHPSMEIATTGDEVRPSCTRAAAGPLAALTAEPPRRLLTLAGDLRGRGARVVVSSICSPNSYASIVAATIQAAQTAAAQRCEAAAALSSGG